MMRLYSQFKFRQISALLAGSLFLAGCASVSPTQAIEDVAKLTRAQTNTSLALIDSDSGREARQAAVRDLLAQPLTMQDAVKLAMLNSRAVQSHLAELGVSQADLAQATRIENPTFSFARVRSGEEVEYERSFKIDILGVLFIPWRSEVANRQLSVAKLRTAGDITRIALDARKAWINAVAAQQSASYSKDVVEAAEASALLARRMLEAGNFSRLAYAREQASYADATAQLARVRQASIDARERLIRVLSLAGEDAARLTLPERLPDLPASPRDMSGSLATAVAKRHDLEMARIELDGLAKSLGLTRTTRFVSAIETSYLRSQSNEGHRSHGYELELQIPLFDWGSAKVARAEAVYLSAANRAAEVAINAESELRSSYHQYRTSYDVAKHYQSQIVPLRKAISDENLLRYNGMLIGVFELLADAREQVASVNASMEAVRAFWEADANLEMAVTAGSPSASSEAATTLSAGAASAGH